MSYMQPETCSWKMKLYKLICKCFCCSWFKTKSLSPEFDDIESGRVERENIDFNFKFQEFEKKLIWTLKCNAEKFQEFEKKLKKLQEIEKLIWISKCISTQTVILPEPVQTNQAPRISNLPILERQMGESIETFLNRLKCKHKVHIIQAKRGNGTDGHGNVFYCFSCRLPHKNHTSFKTKQALEKHCEIKHGLVVRF